MFGFINRSCSHILIAVRHVIERIRQMLRPDTVSLLTGAVNDAVRSKAQLIAENALLRQQMILLLQRHVKPPGSGIEFLTPTTKRQTNTSVM